MTLSEREFDRLYAERCYLLEELYLAKTAEDEDKIEEIIDEIKMIEDTLKTAIRGGW